MAPKDANKKDAQDRKRKESDDPSPEWANGLRQLYDSVVDEPLPDSFNDLLAQFDEDPENSSSDKGRTS